MMPAIRMPAVYSWFVEGFDTTCLRDAKVLLDELRIYRARKLKQPGGELWTCQPTRVPRAPLNSWRGHHEKSLAPGQAQKRRMDEI